MDGFMIRIYGSGYVLGLRLEDREHRILNRTE